MPSIILFSANKICTWGTVLPPSQGLVLMERLFITGENDNKKYNCLFYDKVMNRDVLLLVLIRR